MLDSKEIAKSALRRVDEIKTSTKRSRKRWGIAGILLGVCALASAIAILTWPASPHAPYIGIEAERVPLAAPLLPDENAVPYKGETKDAAPLVALPGYESVTVPAGSQQIEMMLLNPEGNPCYFTFEIALKDTEETIYVSGLVGSGMCIENPALSRTLDKGEYKAVLMIRAYELYSYSAMNGASVDFTLIAE